MYAIYRNLALLVVGAGSLIGLAFTDNPIRGIGVEYIRRQSEAEIKAQSEVFNSRTTDEVVALCQQNTLRMKEFTGGEPVTVVGHGKKKDLGLLTHGNYHCVVVANKHGDTMKMAAFPKPPRVGTKWKTFANVDYIELDYEVIDE